MNYEALAKKRMAAGALIRNPNRQILMLKPTGWLIPGGIIEEDESPRTACQCELKEALGLEIKLNCLSCIDYTSAKKTKPKA